MTTPDVCAFRLPGYEFVASVKGFGDLGFAIVIGETGDLSGYATKERVWKRLGLAVIEGERQGRRASAEEAAKHGYSTKRRSEIWTIADSLFRAQWRGAKEDAPAHALGRYGEIYAARKAHVIANNEIGVYAERAAGFVLAARRAGKAPNTENLAGRLSASHIDNDARRIMTKALVEDLWKAWRA